MTTIVCDRFQISSDSFLTDDCTTTQVRKLFKFKEGVVGVAGGYEECHNFIKWMKNGRKDIPPKMKNVTAIALTKSGILVFDSSIKPYRVDDKFYAIGSGAQAALAIMHYGGSTKDAVRMASKVDPHSGGRIKTMKLLIR